MSLLDKLRNDSQSRTYESLGYSRNPFPARGQVHGDVYVDRQELAPVEATLAQFLKAEGSGRTWAVAAESGVGKSNFLRHVTVDVDVASASGLIELVSYRYLTSQQMTPRRFAEAIVQSFGTDRLAGLFEALRASKFVPSAEISGTALGDFLVAVSAAKGPDIKTAAGFALRWLGGQQTYSDERAIYGISMRERIPPAVALPWLRFVLDLMREHQVLSRVVLLLDEFEDVEAFGASMQNDYVMTLKGLVNAFNLDYLFLILAGQPSTFERMGQRFPSLKTRWEVVRLEPLRRPEEAVALAAAYEAHEHSQWAAQHKHERARTVLRPNEVEIRAMFGDLFAGQPTRGVVQRDFLAKLHDWIEQYVATPV